MSSFAGNINLNSFVALGDSITAGYADSALYYEGQQQAYACIMATQFGAGKFRQPFMRPDSPGVNLSGESKLVLKPGAEAGDFILSRLYPAGDVQAFSENNYATQGPYNNMGVPGAKAITLLMQGFGNAANGPGNYNPFFTRMASDPKEASILSDALLLKPTFFSLFIGNNDALAYALAGGTENSITPVQGLAGIGFEESFRTIVEALIQNNARGIVANLPSPSSIPYFNTIPYNGLLLDAPAASGLNAQYAARGINFQAGENPFIMADATAKNGMRLMEKGDMVLLDVLLDNRTQDYLSGAAPIPKRYTLTSAQLAEVENAIAAYNQVIKTVATEKHLAFADVHALLQTASRDRFYHPATHNIHHLKRGVFSLDGLHPNAFGQLLIANELIGVMNQHYGCSIEPAKSSRFRDLFS